MVNFSRDYCTLCAAVVLHLMLAEIIILQFLDGLLTIKPGLHVGKVCL